MSTGGLDVRVPGAPDAHYTVSIDAGGEPRGALGAWLEAHARAGFATVQDARVAGLFGALLPDAPTLDLEGGEGAKELEVLGRVLDFCAEARLARKGVLVSFGGGSIGDLVGFAASIYMRGIRVVHVPTTLLSQVDSSVGGKTAINLAAGKNLAGTFHHPSAVLCNTAFLSTLEAHEFASGLGEVVKTMLLGGEGDLRTLEADADAIAARDAEALARTVRRCVEIKRDVVEADPTEKGVRRSLNLGHTFGHAIEHAAGFGAIPHGIAVAVGLVLAAEASERALGAAPDLAPRVRGLLDRFGLPTSLDDLRASSRAGSSLTTDALVRGLDHDKKGAVGAPEFVLLKAPGDAALGVRLPADHVAELFA